MSESSSGYSDLDAMEAPPSIAMYNSPDDRVDRHGHGQARSQRPAARSYSSPQIQPSRARKDLIDRPNGGPRNWQEATEELENLRIQEYNASAVDEEYEETISEESEEEDYDDDEFDEDSELATDQQPSGGILTDGTEETGEDEVDASSSDEDVPPAEISLPEPPPLPPTPAPPDQENHQESGGGSPAKLKRPCFAKASLFDNRPPGVVFPYAEDYQPRTQTQKILVGDIPVKTKMYFKMAEYNSNAIKKGFWRAGFGMVKGNVWNAIWGKHLKPEEYKKLDQYVKINHFPNSFQLGRKDQFWRNYSKMQRRVGKTQFNFFPKAYILPESWSEFLADHQAHPRPMYILKPVASSRGRGIRVVRQVSKIPKRKSLFVQRYIDDAYLIGGFKFDLRIYVLVTSFDPLRMYIYDEGLVRFATEKYDMSSTNRFRHLTNYSINKKKENFVNNNDATMDDQGSKWSLAALWRYFDQRDIDSKRIWEEIKDVCVKTMICCESPINTSTQIAVPQKQMCWEIFGIDIMLDSKLKPWLIEVNVSPSLCGSSPLDKRIKNGVVTDMFNMLYFIPYDRTKYKQQKEKEKQQRILGFRNSAREKLNRDKRRCTSVMGRDVLDHLTEDDVAMLQEAEDEYARQGNFERLFPVATSDEYLSLFESPRYLNTLLCAWEREYGVSSAKKTKGIALLKALGATSAISSQPTKSSVNGKDQGPRRSSSYPSIPNLKGLGSSSKRPSSSRVSAAPAPTPPTTASRSVPTTSRVAGRYGGSSSSTLLRRQNSGSLSQPSRVTRTPPTSTQRTNPAPSSTPSQTSRLKSATGRSGVVSGRRTQTTTSTTTKTVRNSPPPSRQKVMSTTPMTNESQRSRPVSTSSVASDATMTRTRSRLSSTSQPKDHPPTSGEGPLTKKVDTARQLPKRASSTRQMASGRDASKAQVSSREGHLSSSTVRVVKRQPMVLSKASGFTIEDTGQPLERHHSNFFTPAENPRLMSRRKHDKANDRVQREQDHIRELVRKTEEERERMEAARSWLRGTPPESAGRSATERRRTDERVVEQFEQLDSVNKMRMQSFTAGLMVEASSPTPYTESDDDSSGV